MKYSELAKEARRDVLTLIHKAGTSHIASNFSVIDLAVVLYENLKKGDRVVWSKGWAAASIYYFLAKTGKIPREDLARFPHEPYFGLAEPAVHGVEVAGGSMGHGLPVAVGIALGKKRAGEEGMVYCIMSDGELNEGTTWESAAVAAHHRLDNLLVFIDVNKWQAMGKTEEVLDMDGTDHEACTDGPCNLQAKWRAFGWDVQRCDGHSHEAIESCLNASSFRTEHPKVIICDTIKGKGVSFFEDHLLYHYKHVTAEEYERAMAELQ